MLSVFGVGGLGNTALVSYALRALQLLNANPALALTSRDLWKAVMAGEEKRPNGQMEEVLQTWEAISSFSPPSSKLTLDDCREWISEAGGLYERINLSPGMRLNGRSNGDHLESLQGGLDLFAELAEIDF